MAVTCQNGSHALIGGIVTGIGPREASRNQCIGQSLRVKAIGCCILCSTLCAIGPQEQRYYQTCARVIGRMGRRPTFPLYRTWLESSLSAYGTTHSTHSNYSI